MRERGSHLPPPQQAIRDKCFHPSGTFVEFPDEAVEQSIPQRFEQIVRRYPERLALKTSDHSFTYAQLNSAANRVARAIAARRGANEEPVALLFEHGAVIIAAILGILKSGRSYVPVDTSLPPVRIAEILQNSGAKLILTNTRYLSQARQLAQNGQSILNYDAVDVSAADGNLDQTPSAETSAIILYTSGSTGLPKGVLHNHRNILVETRNYTNDARICAEDRLSLCQSCSFANSIRNIYGALLNGAALFPYDLSAEGILSLSDWMVTNRITIFHTLETIVSRFLEIIPPNASFPDLRVLRFGGESTSGEDIRSFQRQFAPDCVLMNVIGLTETFTIRRYFVTQDSPPGETKVPLGYGVEDKEILLLDETGREVGANQTGEIAVRSRYLALGYWQRPDLTAAAFIADRHGGDERLYLTGDLGMLRPDGCLVHMGRKDFQVKIRGNKVDITAIEAALLKFDSVRAAVVHAQEDSAGEQRLVAYIVPVEGKAPTLGYMHRALAPSLPDYMIPSALVLMDALPVVPNGRVDRRSLPKPGNSRSALGVPYVAPTTAVEEKLATIWAEILSLDKMGIKDNFFDLGGHSLAATRVIHHVMETFRLELPLKALFDCPTVADMAALIVQNQANHLGEEGLQRMLGEVEVMGEDQAEKRLTEKSARK